MPLNRLFLLRNSHYCGHCLRFSIEKTGKRAKQSLRKLKLNQKHSFKIGRGADGFLTPYRERNTSPLLSQVIRFCKLIREVRLNILQPRMRRYLLWVLLPDFLLSKKIPKVLKDLFWDSYRYLMLQSNPVTFTGLTGHFNPEFLETLRASRGALAPGRIYSRVGGASPPIGEKVASSIEGSRPPKRTSCDTA